MLCKEPTAIEHQELEQLSAEAVAGTTDTPGNFVAHPCKGGLARRPGEPNLGGVDMTRVSDWLFDERLEFAAVGPCSETPIKALAWEGRSGVLGCP